MEKENALYHRYFDLVDEHRRLMVEIGEIKSILKHKFDVAHIRMNTTTNVITLGCETIKKSLNLRLSELREETIKLEEKILEEVKVINAKNKLIREALDGEQLSLKELFGE